MRVHFTDFVGVAPRKLAKHGAFDVSLVTDLPLFIDPFLLFNSKKRVYRALHEEIITYMRFLKEVSRDRSVSPALLKGWFTFPEVKQTWLGFSATDNRGRGLGMDFAASLERNFKAVFADFGDETLTKSSHLEKLGLIRGGVGRDMISDFSTNLIQGYLAEYTQKFTVANIDPTLRRRVSIKKASFDYATRSWRPATFDLPWINDDFILLVPEDILTKDETFISRSDLLNRFHHIAAALPNDVLRAQLNDYLRRVMPRGKRVKEKEKREAIAKTIEQFPAILDHYIRDREAHSNDATKRAKAIVEDVRTIFVREARRFVSEVLEPSGFYAKPESTYDEARERLLFLRDCIENQGGHRIFWAGKDRIRRESDLQILYRLTWRATSSVVAREVNDGRGPVDFSASRGPKDKTLIELKLASNTQLERNLANQLGVYEKASKPTHPSLKGILYFSASELQRVKRILKKLKIEKDPHVVLIDAREDNKPSGSKA